MRAGGVGTFASAVLGRSVFGNKQIVWGTYTAAGGSTGGTVTTGLDQVDMFIPTAGGASIVADAPTVNSTFPLASGSVTLIVTATTTGYWTAIGL